MNIVGFYLFVLSCRYFSGFNWFMFSSFMESIFFFTYLQLHLFLFHSLALHSVFKSPLCFCQIDVFHYVPPVQRVTNISSAFWVFPVFEFWFGLFSPLELGFFSWIFAYILSLFLELITWPKSAFTVLNWILLVWSWGLHPVFFGNTMSVKA